MHKVTRDDVARASGVSKTSVTYILRDEPGVKFAEATRKKVKRIARKLGYQPDFAASSLVRGRTNIIGLLLPSQERQFGAYYSQMISGMLHAATETPFHFLYLGRDQKEKYQQALSRGFLDGVLHLQSDTDDHHIRAVHRHKMPVVTINYLNGLGLPQVSMDFEGVVDQAYAWLLKRGRQRIAFVCGMEDCQPNHRHIARHRELLKVYRHKADITHFLIDRFASEEELFTDIKKRGKWDGIVVDGLSRGVRMAQLMERSDYKIGKNLDMAIFAIGETSEKPPAGTLVLRGQPEKVGQVAWDTLSALLHGQKLRNKTTLIPFLEERSG